MDRQKEQWTKLIYIANVAQFSRRVWYSTILSSSIYFYKEERPLLIFIIFFGFAFVKGVMISIQAQIRMYEIPQTFLFQHYLQKAIYSIDSVSFPSVKYFTMLLYIIYSTFECCWRSEYKFYL